MIEVDPEAVRRLVRAPGAAAAGRGQGADRRDRPDRRAHPRGLARLGAREGRRPRSARTRSTRASRSRRRAATTRRSPRSSRARSPQRRLLAIEYYKENEDEFSHADGRAVRADQRPRGLVRRVLRPAPRERPPLPPGPHQVGDRHRRALRAAPRRRPRRRRRRLAAHRRGAGLAPRARVDLARASALGARGAHRRRGARGRRRDRRARASRASTGSCARCSRRPATRSSSSPRTHAVRSGSRREARAPPPSSSPR